MGFSAVAGQEVDKAEPAGVREAQNPVTGGDDIDVVMGAGEWNLATGVKDQAPAHAQMNEEPAGLLEHDQEVFATALQAGDALATRPGSELTR